MARQVNIKEVEQRIKANKLIMRNSKKFVSEFMSGALKGELTDSTDARKTLSSFITAAKAVQQDKIKLDNAS